MKGFEIIAIVVGIFFAIGIAVGMLAVVALPLLRPASRQRGHRREYRNDDDWRKSRFLDEDDDQRPPRWPGI